MNDDAVGDDMHRSKLVEVPMEVVLLIVAGIVAYFVSKAFKNNAAAGDNLDAIAKDNGLNTFYRCYVTDGIVGLDDTQNAMVWVSKTDKSAFKILRAGDIRRVRHETKPFHNKTDNKIVFTTNDVRNPTLTLDFGLGTKPAEDFHQRIGILFNLT